MNYVHMAQNGEVEQLYVCDGGLNFFDVLREAKERAEATECDQMVCAKGGRVLCVYRADRINSRGERFRGRFYCTFEGSDLYERLRLLKEKSNGELPKGG